MKRFVRTEDESDRDDVSEETVANYALRSQTGEVKEKVVKPLKWPALKEWKLTPAAVIEMQKNDPTLEKYWEETRGDATVKCGKKKQVTFIIKRGMLYRKYKGKRRDNVSLQLVVPQKLRERVLFTAHESLLSAHQGVKRTQDRISAVFYWPSMLTDAKNHVKNCDLCSAGMGRQGLAKAPHRAPAVDRRTLSCDLCRYRRADRTEIEKWL